MFSIVIPNYNKADVIAVTLHSVLNQTFKEFEILIVDDGSTDASVEVIKQFSDERIRLITQKNAGVSVARNTGIRAANESWIAFLDADDWWHPCYLERLVKLSAQWPEANMMATNFVEKQDSANWKPEAWECSDDTQATEWIENLPEKWLQKIPFFTSASCFKKDFLLKQPVLFPEGESFGEDLDLWFRLAEQEKIAYIKDPLVVYRTEQVNSLTRSHAKLEDPAFIERLEMRVQSNKDMTKTLRESSRKFVDHHRLTRARQAILTDDRAKAFQLLWATRRAMNTKRWWMTLFMIMFFSKNAIQSWQQSKTRDKGLIP